MEKQNKIKKHPKRDNNNNNNNNRSYLPNIQRRDGKYEDSYYGW